MNAGLKFTKEALQSLKSKQLQQLAISIGARSSGTKDVLATELQGALHRPKIEEADRARTAKYTVDRPHRLLSLDMGIINLAYCRLELPKSWSEPISGTGLSPNTLKDSLPALREWTRMSVQKGLSEPSEAETANEVLTRDSFHPRVLAETANNLVHQLVIDPPGSEGPPDTILIEKQRFRTMGAVAVQEWTLRVNVFEGMLWAVLHAAKARGDWKGNVYSVLPATTARWWDGSTADAEADKPPQKPSKVIKKRRIERVGKWLQNEAFRVEGKAEVTTHEYLEQLGYRKKTSKPGSKQGRKLNVKLDDLADCLLQALAWVVWEQNRRMIGREGLGALENAQSASLTALQRALSAQDGTALHGGSLKAPAVMRV